jgi:DNA topoisomerase I
MPRLRKVDCSAPGIRRRRRGKGFEYLEDDGGKVTEPEDLERIAELRIPPAWEEVWICPNPRGHLQATGLDAAGRKQYLYHEQWRTRRDQEKFDEMIAFARLLPALRRRVARHLARTEMDRERVLACAVRLLDRGFFRIGGEEYADENGGYGLATLERRHVRVEGGSVVVFDFPGKTGRRQVRAIVDPVVYELARELKRRRSGGEGFLAYRNGRGWVDVRSTDINLFIKQLAGAESTAKDFRTWHATVLAAVALAVSTEASERGRKRAISRAVNEVAHHLGNTPAVCRSSYIDPRLFDRFRAGATIAPTLERLRFADDIDAPATQGAIERAVLELLSA